MKPWGSWATSYLSMTVSVSVAGLRSVLSSDQSSERWVQLDESGSRAWVWPGVVALGSAWRGVMARLRWLAILANPTGPSSPDSR